MGILRRQGVKAFLLALWNDAALILKDKVRAADEDSLLIDGACDAVSHQILHLGVVLLVAQAPALRLLHHGVGHGMGEVLLQAGGQPQHFGFLLGAERYHLSHPGAGVGQSAGLVKDDGIGSRHSLQEFAALDGDVGASRLPHGGEDGQRHGQLQGAGEVHHQHRQSPCHIPGKGKTQQAPGEGIGLQHTFALLYHGAGIDRAAGALGYRDGFSGKGRLVDSDLPLQHQTIHGDDAAGADDYRIPRLDLGHRDQHFALGRAQPDPVHIQRHTPGQIRHRFLPCPLLQQLAHLQQKHDHSGGSKVSSAGGNGNRQGIQQFHLDAAAQQAAQSSPHKGDHVPENAGNPQWRREKQGAGGLAHHLCHQLLLKFPVQRPAAVGGQRGGPLRLLPGKMPNFVQHGLASPIVVQDDAAGSLMDGDLPAP